MKQTKWIESALLESVSHMGYLEFNEMCEVVSGGGVIRVYDESFEVVDCSWIPISKDRASNMAAMRIASRNLQWLNNDISDKEIRHWMRVKIGGHPDVNIMDINRAVKATYGDIDNAVRSRRYTRWISHYTNERIEAARGMSRYDFLGVLAYERGAYARRCWNKSKAKRSRDSFIDAVTFINEHYGYVSYEMVSERMGVSLDRVYKLRSQFVALLNSDIEFRNGKYIKARNKIFNLGEMVNVEDGVKITKQRIYNKGVEKDSRVSRPTINVHWEYLEPYFSEMDSELSR